MSNSTVFFFFIFIHKYVPMMNYVQKGRIVCMRDLPDLFFFFFFFLPACYCLSLVRLFSLETFSDPEGSFWPGNDGDGFLFIRCLIVQHYLC